MIMYYKKRYSAYRNIFMTNQGYTQIQKNSW